jgi:mRNA-degrading endonuclease toxin of MazEF toxin-antitoxin module
VKRGDVYWADIMPRSDSEQVGRRPVIIVSHDAFNEVPAWRSVIVVPISTSGAQRKRGPTAVYLPRGAGGLKKDGVALCHQITTLDRGKITEQIGSLALNALKEVEQGIKASIDLQ